MPVLAVFGPFDWLVVGLYFAAVVFAGLFLSRREKTADATEYFLANRSIPTWTLVVSIVATTLSAATFVGVPDSAFGGDLSYLSQNIGGIIAVFVVAFVFVPKLYAAGTVTIYGYLAQRFGEGARLAVSCAFIFGRMLASGSRVFLAAIPLCLLIFGAQQPSKAQLVLAILLIGVVVTFYTIQGGVRAVIWLDVLQLALVVGAVLVTIAILLHRIPLSLGGIFDILASSTVPATGQSKLTVLHLSNDPTRPYTLWTAIFAAAFLNTAAMGTDHDVAQRFMVSKSPVRGGISIIASQFVSIAVIALFLFVGLLLYIFYDRPDIMGAAYTLPEGRKGIYPWFLLNELPTVLSGISIVGFFAIAQGSMDSAINALAASVVADVYQPIRRRLGYRDTSDNTNASKLIVGIVGFVMCGFAVVCALAYNPRQNTLLDFALGVMTFAFTGMLGVFLTALLTRRGNSASVIAALVAGVLTVTLLQDTAMGWWSTHLLGTSKPWRLAWPWWMTVGSIVAFLVCFAGSPVPRVPPAPQSPSPHPPERVAA